jgi:methylglutamate dehydrogenase subunit C
MTFKRLPEGGLIDRNVKLSVRVDGARVNGFGGDTFASALLAANKLVLGRSFKYHRARGLMAAGAEEPNALLTLGKKGTQIPNLPATQIELADGLRARTQHAWPSKHFDFGAINQAFAGFIGAGFYYKTFKAPGRKAWMFYEKFIRRAAGLGKTSTAKSTLRHDSANSFCDVLVVGSGPAGLSAALTAALAGANVILAEQDFVLGGSTLSSADEAQAEWRKAALEALQGNSNIRLLTNATVKGIYDGNLAVVAVGDDTHSIRARTIIFATGATERPMLFDGNDRPGTMLASALQTYANRFAIVPASRLIIATNNDSAYDAAIDLATKGVEVFVVDERSDISGQMLSRAATAGIAVLAASTIKATHGAPVLDSVTITGKTNLTLPCDALGMSGGWSPTLHLTAHLGSKPVWQEAIAAHVPGLLASGHFAAGACNGAFGINAAIREGEAKAQAALVLLGIKSMPAQTTLPALKPDQIYAITPSKPTTQSREAFVDFQGDVTAKDVKQAQDEGYSNPEHLKRYTTLGMGTDQGKTSNANALAMVEGPAMTTFRPPYTPFLIGQIAGRSVGPHFRPTRLSPLHDWHRINGATFIEAGLWKRAWFYAWAGATVEEAYRKEMEVVRHAVGLSDVSSLGKIDVQGKDALEFLNRLYVNNLESLSVGRVRYGAMLNDDGLLFDDGTVARIAPTQFYVTTTTANAGDVMSWMEFLLQTQWRDLSVHVTSVTDEFGAMALSGPKAREVLAQVFLNEDVSNTGLAHMAVKQFKLQDVQVRVLRMSFSGELGYELHCPAAYTQALWERVLKAGEPQGIKPYGLEALAALRIEKGHIASPEMDKRVSLDDVGLGKMASNKKSYVGEVLRHRAELQSPQRPRLVGLELMEPDKKLRGGAILFAADDKVTGHGRGHVTSVTWSTDLNMIIGLGFFQGDMIVENREIVAVFPLKNETVRLRLVSPHFIDRGGTRLHA